MIFQYSIYEYQHLINLCYVIVRQDSTSRSTKKSFIIQLIINQKVLTTSFIYYIADKFLVLDGFVKIEDTDRR